MHEKIFYALGEKDGMTVECAMQWNESYQESVQCFTNNIPQRDGGTHLTALRQVMTRTINQYIEANEIAKKAKIDTSGDDMREGLTCVLSVKLPDPKFSSQTKDKLVSSEISPVINEVLSQALHDFLEENPNDAKIICGTLLRSKVKRHEDWIFPESYAGVRFEDYNDAIRRITKQKNILLADIAKQNIRYETLDGTHQGQNYETIQR